jgi:hypothetical protein
MRRLRGTAIVLGCDGRAALAASQEEGDRVVSGTQKDRLSPSQNYHRWADYYGWQARKASNGGEHGAALWWAGKCLMARGLAVDAEKRERKEKEKNS